MFESDMELSCWRCPNCGQMYFGEDPPDICDFCGDFTTWQPVVQPKPPPRPPHDNDDDTGPLFQLVLFD